MSSTLLNLLPESKHIPAAQRLLKPKTFAIPLLQTDLAKYYSYAHTGQVLLYSYLRAGALVADPLSTMIQDLVPLALSQSLFCAICLPSVGHWNSGTSDGEFIKGSAAESSKNQKGGSTSANTSRKKLGAPGLKSVGKTVATSDTARNSRSSWPGRIFPTILALVLSIIIPTVPLMVLALVLGAPLYPLYLLPHTLILALHVSLLGTMPIFYTHGVSGAAWRDFSAAWLPFDEAGVWAGTVGAMVGGWVGAIPIALDWDREWQKWPCTVLWGVVLGWALGRLITNGFRFGIGARIDLSVSEYLPSDPATTATSQEKKIS